MKGPSPNPPINSSPPRFPWAGLAALCLGVPVLLFLAWHSHETARELIAKSIMTLAGWLATPFVLESSTAILGLVIVLTYNEWRRRQDGPEWVEMEVKETAALALTDGDKAMGQQEPQESGERPRN